MADLHLPWSIQYGDCILDARGRVVALIGTPHGSHELDCELAAFIVRSANASVENEIRDADIETSKKLVALVALATRARDAAPRKPYEAPAVLSTIARSLARLDRVFLDQIDVHLWYRTSEWNTDREAIQLAMKPGERFVVRRRPA